jgi:hypothetical protein
MDKTERCSQLRMVGFHDYQCRNRAKMTYEGKPYCLVHDPVKRAAKANARYAAWVATRDANANAMERARRCALACEGVPDNELKRGLLARLLDIVGQLEKENAEATFPD